MGRVIVVGSLNIDAIVHVERHPSPGETLLGSDLETRFGGKGANQAVAAARAGARVSMIGRVGDDAQGDEYLRRLESFKIDTSFCRRSTGVSTGHAAIAVAADGENTIIVSPGANGRVSVGDLAPLSSLTADDVVLASLEVPLDVVEEATRRASAAGARVVLNLAPYASLDPEVLDLADPVVVNQHEAELLAADGRSPRSVLVTSGSAGSRWGDDEVPATRADEVIDTTGAGDTYCGTLAAGLAAGLSPHDAMEAASSAAALSVGWQGAQP
ncbi:ribokinase [Humibacter sp. BT305]|uniref:Ribokinase n=1 Tax=Cnuibacter physcomitrellae TaxID=1619308 RepID=A0A1X9LLK2_9MICO|nr:ribokinase [Cnuibacter physcomitrellae]ARJ06054.1 ribokinase [Cnuibacter physcomitrellae]AXH35298.1 ribokinase [Humibacter sp. BT305]MCS5496185.1 ribokinase [Cnuibacter physcomitrellae]